MGSGVLRFATSSANQSVHHFAQETDFTHVNDYALFKAQLGPPLPASQPPTPAFTPLAKPDLRMVEHFLGMSERFTAAQHLFEDRWWTWQGLTLDLLEDYIRRGDLLGWRLSMGQLSGLALIHRYSQNEERLIVSFADAHGDLLADMALDLRRLAAERGLPLVDWKVMAHPDIAEALQAAGYENTWENVLRVYERPIRRGAESVERGTNG
jgi:hypothetical protein